MKSKTETPDEDERCCLNCSRSSVMKMHKEYPKEYFFCHDSKRGVMGVVGAPGSNLVGSTCKKWRAKEK